jgi:phosphate transport system substrate-binding protein
VAVRRVRILMVVAVLAAAGCQRTAAERPAPPAVPGATQGVLRGAGATFPEPIYRRWFAEFSRTSAGEGVRVDYQAVGSGGGIAAFTAGQVDFGATDVPLNPEELGRAQAAGGPLVHIPTVLGAVAVAYNLPGVRRLRMDPGLIAGLFLGQVRTWDDPRVAALNPSARLPHLPVTVVHRSDSSGTTANFTAFLADRVPRFKQRVGQGKVVDWVTGAGADGNDGVAAAAEDMALASVGDFALSLLHTTGTRAYPISSYTYVLVFSRQADPGKGRLLASLLRYMAGPGQASAGRLHYTPIPRDLRESVAAKIRLLHDTDGNLLST